MTKSDAPESFDEFLQAGPDGILVDQNGRAVYYSQYINETFAGFITNHHLTNPAVVRLMDPDTEFPITGTRGSLELKASWKVVAEAEDTSDMFTMTTNVAKLVNRGGKITIDPSQTETMKVAVVGEDWLAVGDAASSYDAMSSAGITKALMHGQIAGRALATYLRDADTSALAAYQDRVFQDFNASCSVITTGSSCIPAGPSGSLRSTLVTVCRWAVE